MLAKLFTLSLLISVLSACSPAPGWQQSTVKSQVYHAGAVIHGKVKKVISHANGKHTVVLKKSKFYVGCGKKRNRIKGFTSSAACGVDPPQVGNWIIVFVCRDGQHWKLNNINLHTGMIFANVTNLNKVKNYTRRHTLTCKKGCLAYRNCTKPITFATNFIAPRRFPRGFRARSP